MTADPGATGGGGGKTAAAPGGAAAQADPPSEFALADRLPALRRASGAGG